LALLLAGAAAACAAPETNERATIIRRVRVFDGERVLSTLMDILIEQGVITRVAPERESRRAADLVEGNGRTVIPGLIDSHMHAGDGTLALAQQIAFGVTTSIGMYDDPEIARRLRTDSECRSAFRSAGLGATVPGGHGTEYGGVVPTLTEPDEADPFLAARLAEGSDFLKIVLGPARMPMLSEATVKALVDAAHTRGRLAVAHVDRLSEAKLAVRAGVDGLVHVFSDQVVDEELIQELVTRRAFVIPTLTIRQAAKSGAEWQGNGRILLDNPAIVRRLPAEIRKELGQAYTGDERWRTVAAQNALKLYNGGVTVLAGSDAPNPGTTWGASLHQELQLLVAAGLSTEAALKAATVNPAARFDLGDRGRILPGMRADLVLLECDPIQRIECITQISSVWSRGIRCHP
jgi:imidazolonepropionase-like amidohydrolase